MYTYDLNFTIKDFEDNPAKRPQTKKRPRDPQR